MFVEGGKCSTRDDPWLFVFVEGGKCSTRDGPWLFVFVEGGKCSTRDGPWLFVFVEGGKCSTRDGPWLFVFVEVVLVLMITSVKLLFVGNGIAVMDTLPDKWSFHFVLQVRYL